MSELIEFNDNLHLATIATFCSRKSHSQITDYIKSHPNLVKTSILDLIIGTTFCPECAVVIFRECSFRKTDEMFEYLLGQLKGKDRLTSMKMKHVFYALLTSRKVLLPGNVDLLRRILTHCRNFDHYEMHCLLNVVFTRGNLEQFQYLFDRKDVYMNYAGGLSLDEAPPKNVRYLIQKILPSRDEHLIRNMTGKKQTQLLESILIEDRSSRGAKFKPKGRTLLHMAVAAGNKRLIRFLLDNNYYDVNDRDDEGCHALHFVVLNQESQSLLDFLLDLPNVEHLAMNEDGWLAFHWICSRQNVSNSLIPAYVAKCPTVIDYLTPDGDSPLHLVAQSGKEEAVEYLIQQGINPNITNCKGATILHILYENVLFSGRLIEEIHADPHIRDNAGRLPFIMLIKKLMQAKDDEKAKEVEKLPEFFLTDTAVDLLTEQELELLLSFAVRTKNPHTTRFLIDNYYLTAHNSHSELVRSFVDVVADHAYDFFPFFVLALHSRLRTPLLDGQIKIMIVLEFFTILEKSLDLVFDATRIILENGYSRPDIFKEIVSFSKGKDALVLRHLITFLDTLADQRLLLQDFDKLVAAILINSVWMTLCDDDFNRLCTLLAFTSDALNNSRNLESAALMLKISEEEANQRVAELLPPQFWELARPRVSKQIFSLQKMARDVIRKRVYRDDVNGMDVNEYIHRLNRLPLPTRVIKYLRFIDKI